jgi:hypothetical protein
MVNDCTVARIGCPAGDKRRIVVVWHEANFLAIGLIRDGQSKTMRLSADGGLGQRAHREDRAGQLLLCQREQEVRLVLVAIDAAPEPPSPLRRPLDARVVSGGDRLRAESACPLEQRGEFQIAVAMCAGQRRTARGVLVDEVRDDGLLKPLLEIEDVMRKAKRRGDAASIVQIVERAARAEMPAVLKTAVLCIQLHGQTNDIMTLLGEQGRGDRGVDAARHGDNDAHSGSDRSAGQTAKLLDDPRQHRNDAIDLGFGIRGAEAEAQRVLRPVRRTAHGLQHV